MVRGNIVGSNSRMAFTPSGSTCSASDGSSGAASSDTPER